MANPVCEVLLSGTRLVPPPDDYPAETGAVVDFLGVVRGMEEGAEISGIDYEAHRQMTEHQLRAVANEAATMFQLKQITIWHRLGYVQAGEASLFVRVGSSHRAEAFRAAGWIVDELKKRAPIWKHPRIRPPETSGRDALHAGESTPTIAS